MKIDGRKVQGSRAIARELERLRPEPALFPADPESAPRSKRPSASATRSCSTRSARSPGGRSSRTTRRCAATPRERSSASRSGSRCKTAAPIVALAARINEATDENVRADLAALPGLLDEIDAWIAAGVADGEQLNAADFQIAPSIAPGDDAAGPAARDREPTCRRSSPSASMPELPRRRSADPAAGLAAAAARRRTRRRQP